MFKFEWNGSKLKTEWKTYEGAVRKLSELKDVLLDEPEEDGDAYYMFRDVHRPEDEAKFKEHKIRYDITVIPPRIVGREYIKTYGHYHPEAGHGLSYPEVYEVLQGHALFLEQKPDASDFFVIEAKTGDVVIMLPNHGHVTVNIGDEPLIMANLVSSEFSSNYEPVKKKHGFAWYYTTEGWIPNERYENHPKIKTLSPSALPPDIYSLFVDYPYLFDWLNRPWKLWNAVR
ncbi:MAG: glucose-6-phosphate isomerase, archaeal [Candidatus Diapherotrites archaeon]|nr:glucose-6-phosphate isomerase, archaeal [Candidatus Diapherotrites archaeon]